MMRGRPFNLALTLHMALLCAPIPAPLAAQEAEVLEVLTDFFDGMYNRDEGAMRARLAPMARFTLLRPGQDSLVAQVFSAEEFVSLILSPTTPELRELIKDPHVHVAGDLAAVWAPYQVHIGGELSHCGVDAAQLMKFGESWQIVSLADNLPSQECGEPWPYTALN